MTRLAASRTTANASTSMSLRTSCSSSPAAVRRGGALAGGRAAGELLAELDGLVLERLVRELLDLGLHRVDLGHDGVEGPHLLALTSAQDLREDAHEKGSLRRPIPNLRRPWGRPDVSRCWCCSRWSRRTWPYWEPSP